MSIQSEISRITDMRDASFTAVANKGVTVPSGSTIDDLPGLINSIQSGGSGESYDNIASCNTSVNAVLTVSTIQAYTLAGFTKITSLSGNNVTTIKENAVRYCTNLTSVYLPALTKLQSGTGTNTNATGEFFSYCSKISSFYAPNLEYVYGNYAFRAAGASTCVWVFPKLRTGSQRLFASSQSKLFDFGPNLSSLLADAFYQGNGSKTVILRRTAGVVSAASADTIRSILKIYVPSALVASYQTATNWSTRYSAGTLSILPIEDSVYETAYANGTPCPQSITNTLTNVTSSNTNTSVVAGEAYSATLTADAGYTISSVTVMMKRVDVTSTVYNSSTGVISIAEVNGPIVITATAT